MWSKTHLEAPGGPEGFNKGAPRGPEAMNCTAGPTVLTHPAFSQTVSPPSGIQQIVFGAVRLTCMSSLLDHPICPVGQGVLACYHHLYP